VVYTRGYGTPVTPVGMVVHLVYRGSC